MSHLGPDVSIRYEVQTLRREIDGKRPSKQLVVRMLKTIDDRVLQLLHLLYEKHELGIHWRPATFDVNTVLRGVGFQRDDVDVVVRRGYAKLEEVIRGLNQLRRSQTAQEQRCARLVNQAFALAHSLHAFVLSVVHYVHAEIQAPSHATGDAETQQTNGYDRRFHGRAFVQGIGEGKLGISADDVMQRGLNDCYFLAALKAIAGNDPALIRKLITENHDGTFTVRFPGQNPIRVDGRFPVLRDGSAAYAQLGDVIGRQRELWPMILEKAYAYLHGSYGAIEGGNAGEAMEELTGYDTTEYFLTAPEATLTSVVRTAWRKNHPVVLNEEAHSYVLVGFCEEQVDGKLTAFLRLADPTKRTYRDRSRTNRWYTWRELKSAFKELYVCKVS